jgi:hypothetical protein
VTRRVDEALSRLEPALESRRSATTPANPEPRDGDLL